MPSSKLSRFSGRAFAFALAAALFCALWIAPQARADTSLVRELAKGKPRVYLVADGADASDIAARLRDRILARKENRHKPEEVRLLTLAEATELSKSDSKFDEASRLELVIRSGMIAAEGNTGGLRGQAQEGQAQGPAPTGTRLERNPGHDDGSQRQAGAHAPAEAAPEGEKVDADSSQHQAGAPDSTEAASDRAKVDDGGSRRLSREPAPGEATSDRDKVDDADLKGQPQDPAPLDGTRRPTDATVTSVFAVRRDKALGYHALLTAPDRERLAHLVHDACDREVGNYRQLAFSAVFRTNRVAVFSAPSGEKTFEAWGALPGETVWNSIEWRPFAERDSLAPDRLIERDEVHFIDRSRETPLPHRVQNLLDGRAVRPTTTLIVRSKRDDGREIMAVSAPSARILERKAAHFPTLAHLAAAPESEEALDLRALGPAPLLLSGGELTPTERASAHSLVSDEIGRRLGLDPAPLGPALSALEAEAKAAHLQPDGEIVRAIASATESRYAWVLELLEYGGQTEYHSVEKSLTADPGRFKEEKPSRPSRHPLFGRKLSEEEHRRKLDEWEVKVRDWERRRQAYESDYDRAECRWERRVVLAASARVTAMLRLVDLKASRDLVIWEQECGRTGTGSAEIRKDVLTVTGHATRPRSLPSPRDRDSAPEALMAETLRASLGKPLDAAAEEILLP